MSTANPLTCLECRPVYLEFRQTVMNDPDLADDPEARKWVISTYLERFHNAGHDEALVLSQLQEEHDAREELSRQVRRAMLFWFELQKRIAKAEEVSV